MQVLENEAFTIYYWNNQESVIRKYITKNDIQSNNRPSMLS